jgi:hypothetical protein
MTLAGFTWAFVKTLAGFTWAFVKTRRGRSQALRW